MPLVHSSHSCTICRQPRSPRCTFPPDTHTCLLLRPARPRPPRRLYCPSSLSHSANTQPNLSPAAHPLASRGGKEERPEQHQRRAGTLVPPEGGGRVGGCRSSSSTPGRERRKRQRKRAGGEAWGWRTGRGGA